tara:strand:- start:1169 stop:2929 length:1761 start_codon:yes stop_codon:yes gene_type:complete
MAEKIEVQLVVDTKASGKNVENLNKDLKETKADISGIEEAGDKMTGGLVSGFKGAVKGVKSMITGLRTMKGAIIATGLGALVILVTSLTAAFTSTEEGQNQLAKAMAVLGAVVDVFTDRLAALGRGLISLFTDPIGTLKGFGKSIQEFVMDKVDLAVESLGFMGSAISKLFKGDFSGALEDAGKGIVGLNKALNPAVMLTEALVKSTKSLIVEITKEGKIAAQIADMRAKAEIVERQLLIDRATANRDRAELLEKAVNKEKFNVQERIGFLEEAGRLEEEITNKEIAAAKLRLDAQIAENELGDSNKEALEKEAQLKANLINLETARLTKQKEVTSQTIALKAEEAAALKAIEDQKIAEEKEAELLKDEEIAAGILKQEEADKLELARKQKLVDEEKAIEEQRRAQQNETFHNAVALAGAETKLGKVLLLAKQLILAKEFIMNAKAQILKAKKALGDTVLTGTQASTDVAGSVAKATNTAPPPFNIPFILTALATGASVMSAVKAAIGSTRAAASAIGGGGGGGSISTPSISLASAPPAFNVVGQGETSQLADAIGGQSPMRAYVVSNDVTTAQGLERNIVEGATI